MFSIILRRFFEMLIGCIGVSAVFGYWKFNDAAAGNQNSAMMFEIFLIILFLIYNGYMMRHLYLKVDDSMDYYLLNILSLIIFFGVSTLSWIFMDKSTYLWSFSFINIFYYMFEEVGSILSIVLFYSVLIISIFLNEKYYDRILSK